MKSDVIVVSSKGQAMETALQQAEAVAAYKHLSPRDTLHLRLLTEEMMGMMRSITGETKGEFWIEDEGNVYQLHLLVKTRMDSEKRSKLLSASTSGKNESARGLMGMLRDFFDQGADEDVAMISSQLLEPSMHAPAAVAGLGWEWSMSQYREELLSNRENHKSGADEAWDELEKSVVANVADEVKVSIKGQKVEMIIYKKVL